MARACLFINVVFAGYLKNCSCEEFAVHHCWHFDGQGTFVPMSFGCYVPYMCSGKPLSIAIVMYYDICKLLENYEMPAHTLFYYYYISFLISSTITRSSSPLPNNVHRRYSYPCVPVTGTWWMLVKGRLKVWVQHLKHFMNIICDMAILKLWMQLIKVDLPHGVSFDCSV